ncbi:hypothetical protein [Halocatena marina]|uniref:Uncharacterized protein n=1 Tax=Halocatena marina TaxID=2934937 RepID=A0ABD5YGV5_9EURY|nr:hypothetical protein [Halocatena marina]
MVDPNEMTSGIDVSVALHAQQFDDPRFVFNYVLVDVLCSVVDTPAQK